MTGGFAKSGNGEVGWLIQTFAELNSTLLQLRVQYLLGVRENVKLSINLH